jgi:hypothetical protein
MQDVQTIYRQEILPLPASEKIRLAAIILQDLSNGEKPQISALDLMKSLPDEKVFSSAKEAGRTT